MSDPSEIAKAFVGHYYNTYQTNPDALAGLYQAHSTLTFDQKGTVTGPQAIVEALKSPGQMAFDQSTMTIDTQMSVNQNALVILVTGKLRLAGQDNVLQFSQLFQLVATGPGAYYLNNDIFRLVYS